MRESRNDLRFPVPEAAVINAIFIAASLAVCWLIFTVSLAAHEFAHYLAARRQGIAVSEVSIGLGCRLADRQLADGARVIWRFWPMAGFTRWHLQATKELAALGSRRFATMLVAGAVSDLVLTAFLLVAVVLWDFVFQDWVSVAALAGGEGQGRAAILLPALLTIRFDLWLCSFFLGVGAWLNLLGRAGPGSDGWQLQWQFRCWSGPGLVQTTRLYRVATLLLGIWLASALYWTGPWP